MKEIYHDIYVKKCRVSASTFHLYVKIHFISLPFFLNHKRYFQFLRDRSEYASFGKSCEIGKQSSRVFIVLFNLSIAAGRSSARYYGNASPLCHSVASSTRNCAGERERERGKWEQGEESRGGYRVVTASAAALSSVSFLCNRSTLIFHRAASNLTPSTYIRAYPASLA